MALTPQNNDAFFREVDDELRRSRLDSFGKRWGLWIIVAVLVALAAFGGWLWYQHVQEKRAGESGERLDRALTALSQNQGAKAKPLLDGLVGNGKPGYRAAARLALADLAQQDGKAKDAIAGYKSVADDTALDQNYRDLALIRQVAAAFDTLLPARVIALLQPLANANSAWFGSAGEMTAAAHLKMNRPDLAGPILAAIAKDEKVPTSLRQRSAQMAASMGLDVTMPGGQDVGGEQQ